MYARNADSADGRCLIYRSVWSLCTERPFCGWGSDAMQARYTARLILHKRIKVNGAEVESIRQEARTLLSAPAR